MRASSPLHEIAVVSLKRTPGRDVLWVLVRRRVFEAAGSTTPGLFRQAGSIHSESSIYRRGMYYGEEREKKSQKKGKEGLRIPLSVDLVDAELTCEAVVR